MVTAEVLNKVIRIRDTLKENKLSVTRKESSFPGLKIEEKETGTFTKDSCDFTNYSYYEMLLRQMDPKSTIFKATILLLQTVIVVSLSTY